MINVFPPRNGAAVNATPNQATLAYLRWTAGDYDEQQTNYTQLRAWHRGEQGAPLTDRQRLFLTPDSQFREWSLNYLRLPVELCVERLIVSGFDGPDGIGGEGGLLDEWWTSGRMDAVQSQLHRATAVDGDTYLLVEWDEENDRPIFSHEPAYDGDEGMKVHYLSNLRREMTMASKVWTENRFDDAGRVVTLRRLNLYMPTAIEKYQNSGKGWQPYRDKPSDPWPLPWPLGIIPVVHFRWADNGGNWGEAELEGLIHIQAAINKAALDEVAAADIMGMPIPTLTGATIPASTPIQAGTVLQTPAADARWGTIPAGDLGQLREQVSANIIRMAQVAHIPLQYFQVTGAIASAATQAADDSQLVAKVKTLAVALGNAWEDAMYIALKLNQAYGNGRDLARGENVETRWADFERVDRLAIEERRAGIVQALSAAGLAVEGIVTLAALGYSQEEQAALLQQDIVTGVGQ